jgi:flagellar biosynthesis protein FliR
MYDLLLNQSKILQELSGMWVIVLLIFSRVLAFASTAPLIGHKSIPALIKISFSMLLTLIILPNLQVPEVYPKDYQFIYLIVINVVIGLFIGWVAHLVLEIGRTAGEMLDMQMGLNAATIFDPGTQTQSTIIGRFFDMLTLTLFISIGGMEKIIEGLYKSFNAFPIIIYELNINFDKLLKATTDVIAIGFLIVSPIVITILAVDLILGLMSRAAPQINAFQVSFSIKPCIGIILLIMLLPALFQILASLFSNPNRFF